MSGEMRELAAVAEGSLLNQRIEEAVNAPLPAVVDQEETATEENLDHAKSVARQTADLGLKILKSTNEFANSSSDPKIIGILPALIRETTNAAKVLAELSEKRRSPRGEVNPNSDSDDTGSAAPKSVNITDSNVIVASPTQLQRALRGEG